MTATTPGTAPELPHLDLRQLRATIEDHAGPHGTVIAEGMYLVIGDATNSLTLRLGDGSDPRDAVKGALRLASLAGEYAVKLAIRLRRLEEAEYRATWDDAA